LLQQKRIDFGAIWAATSRGASLRFDGPPYNHYCETPDQFAELNGLRQMTVSVWVYRKGGTNYDGVINRETTTSYAGWNLSLAGAVAGPDDLQMRVGTLSTQRGYTTNASVPLNIWLHVVGVYDGLLTGDSNRLKIYVNGIQQTLSFAGGAIPSVLPSLTRPIRLGFYEYAGGSYYFNGHIDMPMIWSRALRDSEIKQLYETPYCMLRAQVQRLAMMAATVTGGAPSDPSGIINNPIPM
jgi:hypothetical protein